VDCLQDHWCELTGVYGTDGVLDTPCCGPVLPTEAKDGWEDVGSYASLVERVLDGIPKQEG
jgi:hypothetical protein